jgi:hypothetical protein
MATLNIPYSFTAGTPAVASQVNANFDAIVNWANGGISTDAFGLLTARTIALPSAPLPLKTIVPIYQTAAEPALYIVNDSQGVPLTIVQNQAFGSPGKAIIRISDTTTQIQSGSPTIWLELANGATAPALLVQHGAVDTMRLTRTQLDLFNGAVQATSAGVVSATTGNFTTVNATTVAATDVNTTNVTATGLLDLTAPASDAIVAEIKGRSSDNNAIVQFKSNDDATVYASATSSPSGLTLNLPDTADSYTFKVNDVTKAVIDNNGIDANYLYNQIPASSLPPGNVVNSGVINFSVSVLQPGNQLISSVNVTCGQNRVLFVCLTPTASFDANGVYFPPSEYLPFYVTGPNGYSKTLTAIRRFQSPVQTGSYAYHWLMPMHMVLTGSAGTYTVELRTLPAPTSMAVSDVYISAATL